VDLAQYRGKMVVVQYWATWCEPCKADMSRLKELLTRYGRTKGFTVIGVNLDHDTSDVAAFLKQEKLPWEQLYEPGGLESRLANEMGILTLPTMLLIDKSGRVLSRNVHVGELEAELRKLK
jgi:thiol-disulfide isomerase/thioredoxin